MAVMEVEVTVEEEMVADSAVATAAGLAAVDSAGFVAVSLAAVEWALLPEATGEGSAATVGARCSMCRTVQWVLQ